MHLKMNEPLHNALDAYVAKLRRETGVRTVSRTEATRMAIRSGLLAAGINPDDPHGEGAPNLKGEE